MQVPGVNGTMILIVVLLEDVGCAKQEMPTTAANSVAHIFCWS
jgi:hypothetical protein